MRREAGVDRDDAGARLEVGADTVDGRRMNDARAIRDQHARADVAAQSALSMSGMVLGVRVVVVVGRLRDGKAEDRRELQQQHGGDPSDPEGLAHLQHASKVVRVTDNLQDRLDAGL